MSAPQPGCSSRVPQETAAGLWGHTAAMWGTSGTIDVPLSTDKLSATLPPDKDHHPVVLVNCGSFNPPTIMHLRMFDVAAQLLKKVMPQICTLPLSRLVQCLTYITVPNVLDMQDTRCSACALLCMWADCTSQI